MYKFIVLAMLMQTQMGLAQGTEPGPVSAAAPLVCNLTDAALAKRAADLRQHLFATALTVQQLPDGMAFGYAPSDSLHQQLIDFVNFERKCCPSFRIAIVVQPGGGQTTLQVSGSAAIKRMLMQLMQNEH